MTTNIQPIEIDGQHWISVSKGGRELERRGPFSSAGEAGAMARRLVAVCRSLFHGDWPMHTETHRVAPTPAAPHRRRDKHA